MSRKVRVALALIVAAVALALGIATIVETDREAIERVTNRCRLAFLDRDADAIVACLTKDARFRHGARTGPLEAEVRRRVEQDGRRVKAVSLGLREIEIDGDDARALWRVTLRMRAREHFPFARFDVRVEYRREPEDWKIRLVTVGST